MATKDVAAGKASDQPPQADQDCGLRDNNKGPRTCAAAVSTESTVSVRKARQGRSGARSAEGPLSGLRETPLLRCPAGHGMQWIQARSCEGSNASARDSTLKCRLCLGSIAISAAFHSCAVCFRDSGNRHAVCSGCSQGTRALEKCGSG